MRSKMLAFLGVALLTGPLSAHAAIVIGAAGSSYAQNFDSLAGAGTANTWTNDATLPGWTLAVQPAGVAPATYRAGSGTDNTAASQPRLASSAATRNSPTCFVS